MITDNALLISVIYQLLDSKADIGKLGPAVQEFIQGIVQELKEIREDDEYTANCIFHYADTVLNKHLDVERKLH